MAPRLHLGLLLAHLFSDCNGRTARLAAAAVLIRAGHRTSLVTCVEQHFSPTPARYPALLGRLRRGIVHPDEVIDGLLASTVLRTLPAAWTRARRRLLLAHARGRVADPVAELSRFECGDPATVLEPHAGQPIEPWTRITGHLRPDIAVELRAQLGRVAGDLAMAGAPPDSG